MTNKETIIAALTEARKTSENNVDRIAAATFALSPENSVETLSVTVKRRCNRNCSGSIVRAYLIGLDFEEKEKSNDSC